MRRLLLLLCLWALASPALAENLCTIQALRQQAPPRLQATYETPWGNIAIDAPVILPEADALPAVAYRLMSGYVPAFPSCATTTYADPQYPFFYFWVNTEWDNTIVPKGYGVSRLPYDGRDTAENNPYPPDAAAAFAEALIRQYTPLEPGVDTTTPMPLAFSAWKLYDWNTGVFLPEEAQFPLADPLLNMGNYQVECFQSFHGVPLVRGGGYYFEADALCVPVADSNTPLPLICADIIDEEHYEFSALLCEEVGLLLPDTPLAGFDRVLRAIEEQVMAGHITAIQSLTLCPLVGHVPPDGSANGVYWALPSWRLDCAWASDPSAPWDAEPRAIRIDAQTAAFPDTADKSRTRLRHHPLITWDE